MWRFGKPILGAEKGEFGELEAMEERRGPPVEVGVEERREVMGIKKWWENVVKNMGEKEGNGERVDDAASARATASSATASSTWLPTEDAKYEGMGR